jgi:D-ornithine---citrate ligase
MTGTVDEVLTADGPTAAYAAAAEEQLRAAAPDLVGAFRDALPAAADTVARRVFSAAYREDLVEVPPTWSGERVLLPRAGSGFQVVATTPHAFDRLEVADELRIDPAVLLAQLCQRAEVADIQRVGGELADATAALAIGYARRAIADLRHRERAAATGARDCLDLAADLPDADEQCLFFERLATDGHNLHPCGRTRWGWSVADLLAHDLESSGTHIGLVGVRRELHIGDDIGAELARHYPEWAVGLDRHQYALTPVHRWQRDRIIRGRHAGLIEDESLVLLDDTDLAGYPTASLRTLLLAPDDAGQRRYLKLSLDIQVTSTRRGISAASAHNGPILSAVLGRLVDGESLGRFLLMSETAGCSALATGGSTRDLSAIVRSGLTGRLAEGELPVPALALPARSPVTGRTVLAELVARFAARSGIVSPRDAAIDFLDEYARLLLPPLLRLATGHGVAMEAHLQNCIPTFLDGLPHRMAIRDLAGLRIYPPRLRPEPPLWPGSLVVTGDLDVMRSKLAYTALQAHLGEVIVQLGQSHGLSERAAWSVVRSVLDEEYGRLAANPALAARAVDDHAFLTAPSLPHKALLRMRLSGPGDIYVQVDNPLRSTAAAPVLP